MPAQVQKILWGGFKFTLEDMTLPTSEFFSYVCTGFQWKIIKTIILILHDLSNVDIVLSNFLNYSIKLFLLN